MEDVGLEVMPATDTSFIIEEAILSEVFWNARYVELTEEGDNFGG